MRIESGCAACGLPADCAKEVELKEFHGANAGKITGFGAKVPTFEFQNGGLDTEKLKFKVMDKLHKPFVAAGKIVATNNRIVLQEERRGGSYIESLTTNRHERKDEQEITTEACAIRSNLPKRQAGPSVSLGNAATISDDMEMGTLPQGMGTPELDSRMGTSDGSSGLRMGTPAQPQQMM